MSIEDLDPVVVTRDDIERSVMKVSGRSLRGPGSSARAFGLALLGITLAVLVVLVTRLHADARATRLDHATRLIPDSEARVALSLSPADPGLSSDALWQSGCTIRTDRSKGSGGMLGVEDGVLRIVTAAHVLGAYPPSQAQAPQQVKVVLPSGAVSPAVAILLSEAPIDMAVIEIDARALLVGRDYVALSACDASRPSAPGDDAAIIGAPGELERAVTFGTLDGKDTSTRTLVSSASVSPGSSGGPLVVRRDTGWRWAGTVIQLRTDGAAVALDAALLAETAWRRFPASREGLQQAMEWIKENP